MLHHIKRLAKKKSVIGLCSVLAVSGTIYGVEISRPAPPTRYVLASVARGTLVVSVTGSGQASDENQIDVKPKVSGALTKVLVKQGQEIKAGTPMFELEKKDALKTVRDASQSVTDAKISVRSSELSLQKLKEPADSVSVLQAKNSLNQAKRALADLQDGPDPIALKQAENDLIQAQENAKVSDDGKTPQQVRNAYDAAVPALKSMTQTLQQSLADADAVLGVDNPGLNDAYEHQLSVLNSSALAIANNAYGAAKISVLAMKTETDALKTLQEDPANIDRALQDAETSLNAMQTFLQKIQDVLANTIASISFSQSSLDALRATIATDRTNVSSKLSGTSSQTQSIDQAKASFLTAQLSVDKAQIALDELKQGPDAHQIESAQERVIVAEDVLAKLTKGTDAFDITVSENALARSRSSLASAQNHLADTYAALQDYTVRAPFDGVVARVPVRAQDQVGASTALATFLTHTKIAQISLNEVDAAKVKVGQKATLTFDAVPDLSIAGTVSEVDDLGAVTQGVVNYSVKISFDTQDARVKSGMSLSVSIATDVRTDVLLVPNGAIRRIGSGASVQTLPGADMGSAQADGSVTSPTPPESVAVETDIANDAMTVVASGLKEGDRIVVRTIDAAALAKSKASGAAAGASSGIRLPGATGGGNATFIRRAGG
jgi:HlyD family secretion protein